MSLADDGTLLLTSSRVELYRPDVNGAGYSRIVSPELPALGDEAFATAALSDDGDTVAIRVEGDVRIYELSLTNLSLSATLTAPDPNASFGQGLGVATDGTIVVSDVITPEGPNSGRGLLRVFTPTGTGYSEQIVERPLTFPDLPTAIDGLSANDINGLFSTFAISEDGNFIAVYAWNRRIDSSNSVFSQSILYRRDASGQYRFESEVFPIPSDGTSFFGNSGNIQSVRVNDSGRWLVSARESSQVPRGAIWLYQR